MTALQFLASLCLGCIIAAVFWSSAALPFLIIAIAIDAYLETHP